MCKKILSVFRLFFFFSRANILSARVSFDLIQFYSYILCIFNLRIGIGGREAWGKGKHDIAKSRLSYLTRVSTVDPILQYVCSAGCSFLPQTVINLSLRSFLILTIPPSSFVLASRFSRRDSLRFHKRSRGAPALTFVDCISSSLSSLDRNRAHRHPTRKRSFDV